MEFIGFLVFLMIFLIGGAALIFMRQPWSDELIRLDKHKRKMTAKYHEDEQIDIFLQQRNADFLSVKLAHAGLEAKYEQMKMQWVVFTLVGGVLGAIVAMQLMPELLVLGFIFGLIVGAGAFIAYISHLAKARQAKIMEQLPQVLETMVSTLRAGSPVIEVWKVLADTAADPSKSEFKRGLISLQLGKPFREVMAEMSDRIPTPDFKLLSTAIFISQDVGGNLAEVVATIAAAIRARFKIRDFLNSLTAQGKVTAIFIGSLPYLVTLLTFLISPGYIVPFLNNPIARIIMGVLIVWEGIGAWILIKMTTFEI